MHISIQFGNFHIEEVLSLMYLREASHRAPNEYRSKLTIVHHRVHLQARNFNYHS